MLQNKLHLIAWYLYREMPIMNLEKMYNSPFRSFNFQRKMPESCCVTTDCRIDVYFDDR